MPTVKESLDALLTLPGAKAAAIVDSTTGMILGHVGSAANLEIASAGNTEVVRAQLKSLRDLGLKDSIDDILITLGTQYDIVRPLAANPTIFLYLTMDKSKSNLALARHKVEECEAGLIL